MHRLGILLSAAVVFAPAVANAEIQISAYGGMNGASDSDVTVDTPLLTGTYDVGWDGDSFKMPPYWGLRGTWWLNTYERPHWGVAIDFTHTKVKADDLGTIPFSTLEFTDGLNTIALTGLYRTPLNDRFSFYAGAGAGIAFPHVEVRTIPNQGKTFEYQLTGPVVQALIGVSVALGSGFSVFAEYKASHSWNKADLVGGGTLETNILTHQLAIGVSLSIGSPPQF